MQKLKYSRFLQETSQNYRYLKFRKVELSHRTQLINYTLKEALTIVRPYLTNRFSEQFKVVIPVALYLVLFQLLLMKQSISEGMTILFGLAGVILGLMFFMEGLKVGLMPFGESIGYFLPIKAKMEWVLVIAFALGVGATFAEPAMGVLKEAGKIVSPLKAPLLYAMLNQYSFYTVTAVSLGVGIATLLGILMFIKQWSLKTLIYLSLAPTLALTIYSAMDKNLSPVIGLAWDCGAVTTGPVTVPLVLALGIGVSSVIKHKHTANIAGFGIVTLASLWPILMVLLLGILLNIIVSSASLTEIEPESKISVDWLASPATVSFILAFRAIAPLMFFLYVVQKMVLKEQIHRAKEILYGIVLCFVGMSLFNLGLSYGLTTLGNQVGSVVPAAYAAIETVTNSPLYSATLGLTICFLFAFFLGYGATLAEPALNALGLTVENLTNGAFRKKLVMLAVSIGVALGLGFGVIKILFDIKLIYFLVPLYALAILLTILSEEKYVNIGWDSAGVTTGPITVPLVLAMGLGFAGATGAVDGFGVLALASLFPILSVLSFGLYLRILQKKVTKEEENV